MIHKHQRRLLTTEKNLPTYLENEESMLVLVPKDIASSSAVNFDVLLHLLKFPLIYIKFRLKKCHTEMSARAVAL